MDWLSFFSSAMSQIWAITNVVNDFKSSEINKRKAYNQAIASMRRALNRTSSFLSNDPDFSNRNILNELSDMWNNASKKVGIVDYQLGEMLGNKSRFWSNHELFIMEGRTDDILSLDEIVSKIDELYNQLR